tara:strand:+ start:30 stop:404 length:375 start_codon:yes stop_codon:yes gene_type:complete
MFEEKIINLVIRQTNYDRETAIQKLNYWNGDYMKAIKEYLNPEFQKKKGNPELTKNQQIMSSIRGFMDDVYKGYELRKKQAEEYKLKREIEIKKRESLKKKLEFINEVNEEDGDISISEVIDSS